MCDLQDESAFFVANSLLVFLYDATRADQEDLGYRLNRRK